MHRHHTFKKGCTLDTQQHAKEALIMKQCVLFSFGVDSSAFHGIFGQGEGHVKVSKTHVTGKRDSFRTSAAQGRAVTGDVNGVNGIHAAVFVQKILGRCSERNEEGRRI